MRRISLLAFGLGLASTLQADDAATVVQQFIEAGNLTAARERLNQKAAVRPDDAMVHFWLGVVSERENRTDEAVRELERATALDPKNSSYLLELGGAYGTAAEKAGLFAKLGWAKKCQVTLEKAVELDPASIPARNGLISFYRAAPSFAGGSLPKAFAQAEEIRKLDAIAGAAVLGQLYVDDRKPDQAFALYEDALKQAPDNYGLLYGFGRASAQTGKHLDRGEDCLRRCLALKPQPGEPGAAPVHWRLGNIAERRGKMAEARAEYELALQVDPHFGPAAKSLAKLKS
jgi:tetratricopeptide (TPR) repeat protein